MLCTPLRALIRTRRSDVPNVCLACSYSQIALGHVVPPAVALLFALLNCSGDVQKSEYVGDRNDFIQVTGGSRERQPRRRVVAMGNGGSRSRDFVTRGKLIA